MKLSTIRRGIAVLVLAIGTLYLLDLPFLKNNFFHFFTNMQLVPAILSGAFVTLAILIILTLLFGRVYCSVVCPLGILQDVILFFNKRRIRRNRDLRKQRRLYQYEAPRNRLRYGILFFVLVSVLLGSTALLILLDPYSIYTRFSRSFLHPLGMGINNVLAYLFNAFDNYSFSSEDNSLPEWIAFVVSMVTMIFIVVLTLKKDRFWCNTICPVGTVLGLLSRFAVFRVKIDQLKCVSCKKCAQECKSHAINIDDYSIDYSRCVSCFNCIDSCDKQRAIHFKPSKLNLKSMDGVKMVQKKQSKVS